MFSIRIYISIYIYTHTDTCMHAYILPYTHVCMYARHACMHLCKQTHQSRDTSDGTGGRRGGGALKAGGSGTEPTGKVPPKLNFSCCYGFQNFQRQLRAPFFFSKDPTIWGVGDRGRPWRPIGGALRRLLSTTIYIARSTPCRSEPSNRKHMPQSGSKIRHVFSNT